MTFYAIEIDPTPAFGFQGGPEFSTNVQTLASGREKRNGDWFFSRHKFSAPFQNITNDQYLRVKQVFLIMRGKLHTFLQRDWADFNASNEQFGAGDGTTKIFQLVKTVSEGGGGYQRVITKPDVLGGIVIKVNGTVTAASVDATTGLVTFSSAPANAAVLTWSGQFYNHVRFDIDSLPFTIDNLSGNVYVQNGSVDLIEVLEGDD